MTSLLSDARTKNRNLPAAAAFTAHVMFLVWSPSVTCEEPLPVSVQRDGTSRKLPRTLVGPLTCHLCVSECE
jgi:hypothetical protein